MSSTCLFSDIVLPTATWYEKDDMNTSDMHPFIHPLSAAVDPAWESRSDWEIYKGIAKAFSQLCVGHLGKETDVVLQPLLHDSPAELSQPCEVLDWRKGECDLIPGKTAPNIVAVERDYPATYERFTSLGPLMDKLGNGGKGISWNTQDEIDFLGKLNYTKREGPAQGLLHRKPTVMLQSKRGRRWARSPDANIPIWRCTKRTRRFAFAIFRRSHVKLSPAPHGPVWKAITFPITRDTPTFMS